MTSSFEGTQFTKRVPEVQTFFRPKCRCFPCCLGAVQAQAKRLVFGHIVLAEEFFTSSMLPRSVHACCLIYAFLRSIGQLPRCLTASGPEQLLSPLRRYSTLSTVTETRKPSRRRHGRLESTSSWTRLWRCPLWQRYTFRTSAGHGYDLVGHSGRPAPATVSGISKPVFVQAQN